MSKELQGLDEAIRRLKKFNLRGLTTVTFCFETLKGSFKHIGIPIRFLSETQVEEEVYKKIEEIDKRWEDRKYSLVYMHLYFKDTEYEYNLCYAAFEPLGSRLRWIRRKRHEFEDERGDYVSLEFNDLTNSLKDIKRKFKPRTS